MPDSAPQDSHTPASEDTPDESDSGRTDEHKHPGEEATGEDVSAQAEREQNRQLDTGEENPA